MGLPDLSYESTYWQKGLIVAGADEAGRGAFAGPLVAAACAFAPISDSQFIIYNQSPKIIINDSKKLSAKQREISAGWIKENSIAWGVGEASVAEIDKLGIARATNRAFRRALKVISNKGVKIEALLVDAFYIPYARGINKDHQEPIIKGDSLSFSIAAASIIAKVHRDACMRELGSRREFCRYQWDVNKGYGTPKHCSELVNSGPSKHHRTAFVETYFSKTISF